MVESVKHHQLKQTKSRQEKETKTDENNPVLDEVLQKGASITWPESTKRLKSPAPWRSPNPVKKHSVIQPPLLLGGSFPP